MKKLEKEIRTLVGVDLETLNALFAAEKEVREFFLQSEGVKTFFPDGTPYVLSHELLPGSPSSQNKIPTVPALAITKVQLMSDRENFVVRLVISNETIVAHNRGGHTSSGTLCAGATIRSYIDRALGYTNKIEPSIFVPTNEE